ncbi:MAG: acetate--CoA ligase family protein, partial [Thermoplasmatota archaeon]
KALAARREWLTSDEVFALLSAYGLRTLRATNARDAESAARAARAFGKNVATAGGAHAAEEQDAAAGGRRVALKAVAPNLVHKSDAGGVALDVAPERVAREFAAMRERLAAHGFAMEGVVVQEMAMKGRELLLGATADPKFGPLVAFGLGGVAVEALRDVAFRLAPLTDEDARRLVRSIRGWPLLNGYRGEPPADVAAIEDALLRLSRLVTDFPEIAEVEVNPLVVGALVSDRVGAGRSEQGPSGGDERPRRGSNEGEAEVGLRGGGGCVAIDARVRLWPAGEAPRAPGVVPEIRARAAD